MLLLHGSYLFYTVATERVLYIKSNNVVMAAQTILLQQIYFQTHEYQIS